MLRTMTRNLIVNAAHAAAKARNCPDCREIAAWGEISQPGEPLLVKGSVRGCPVHTGEVTVIIHREFPEELRTVVRTHRSEAGLAFGKELLDRILREAVWPEIMGCGTRDEDQRDEDAGGSAAGGCAG